MRMKVDWIDVNHDSEATVVESVRMRMKVVWLEVNHGSEATVVASARMKVIGLMPAMDLRLQW